jgi:peptide/nickel transport system permease protein
LPPRFLRSPSGCRWASTALRRDTWLSSAARRIARRRQPADVLIGILLILVFAVILGWLSSFGRGETVALGWWTTAAHQSGLKALILPAITLSLFR